MPDFDPNSPIETALTPPSKWYTSQKSFKKEKRSVFLRNWQPVARADQLQETGAFVAGEIAGEPYFVIRNASGIQAFSNVCRHHATCLLKGTGKTKQIVCPYHGWTYNLEGNLDRAPFMKKKPDVTLPPLEVAEWGPWVWIQWKKKSWDLSKELEPFESRLEDSKYRDLKFHSRRTYEVPCNWKVFVDNYLDGGMHVGIAHPGLGSQLALNDYQIETHPYATLQFCASDPKPTHRSEFSERVGSEALYLFVYPNFMINRYGPMMDTNWVLPLDENRTLTVFDYFFEDHCSEDFIEQAFKASDQVQKEDIALCEAVQKGLESSSYDQGIYASREEGAYEFHRRLFEDLS